MKDKTELVKNFLYGLLKDMDCHYMESILHQVSETQAQILLQKLEEFDTENKRKKLLEDENAH